MTTMDHWLDRATVRHAPLPLIEELESLDKVFFSEDEVATLAHPLIADRGSDLKRTLLIQHLFTFMHFTDHLELKAVNPVVQRIAHGEMDIMVSDSTREEAHMTYADEAWHALVCNNVMRQVQGVTGTVPAYRGPPRFLSRLNELQAHLSPPIRRLSEFLFVVVSETMISKTLSKVPKDTNVVTAVREMLRHHSIDEGRHHRFFSQLFEQLWPALTAHQKEKVGVLLPEFIRAFIDPDTEAIKAMLGEQRFTAKEIGQIIHETFPPRLLELWSQEASKSTLSLFERNGVFEDARTSDAFVAAGLPHP